MTPRLAALTAVTVLQERLQILAQSIRDTTDSAPHCYVGLDNEYQRRVTLHDGKLGVEQWGTHSCRSTLHLASDPIVLANEILAAIAADAAQEVALSLGRSGFWSQR